MSAATIDRGTAPAASAPLLSFGGTLRSEWIKLRSLRSTVWSFGILVLLSLGLAALMSSSLRLESTGSIPAEQQITLLTQASTFGVYFGQLVVCVLGVLMISGEYSTGMIRSTLTAVPRRLPALAAKAITLFAATFAVGLVATFGAYAVAAPILAGQGIHAGLGEPEVLRALIGGAFYLGIVAVVALGIGAMVRSSAGGIAIGVGILLVLPTILQIIPVAWLNDLVPYLLSDAGFGLIGLSSFSGGSTHEWWQDLLIVLGWLATSMAGAAVLLKRRDA